MFAAKDSFCVRLPEFTRSLVFRWALLLSGAFIAGVLVIFLFVLLQAYATMTADVDGLIESVAANIAARPPERRIEDLNEHLRVNPRKVKLGGLFTSDGRRVAGNIAALPAGLKPDAPPQLAALARIDETGNEQDGGQETVRAIARRLPDGQILVIGRIDYEFAWIVSILRRALTLGLIPALAIPLLIGFILSLRSERRLDNINRQIQRIVAGELRERLPLSGAAPNPLDRLAVLVNGMLDEIETLVRRLAGVGDDIAHDLRTPLTRVRVSLERARQKANSLEQLRRSVDEAIAGLDQSLAIVTALLRIAEIEHRARIDHFGAVALRALVREVAELYEPIADEKRIALIADAPTELSVHGDRDLLFEAVTNLVDNAVKFTPEGGRVEIALARRADEAVVRVVDTGPGIEADERDLVGRRFYRSDKSRRSPGLGLGLSLVNAIVKLHGFSFSLSCAPGCVAEIAGPIRGHARPTDASTAVAA
jgi:signal transduction histidine kinase